MSTTVTAPKSSSNGTRPKVIRVSKEVLQETNNRLEGQMQVLKEEMAQAVEAMAHMRERNMELRSELLAADQRNDTYQQFLDRLVTRNGQLEVQLSNAEDDADRAYCRVADLESLIARVEERNAALNDTINNQEEVIWDVRQDCIRMSGKSIAYSTAILDAIEEGAVRLAKPLRAFGDV